MNELDQPRRADFVAAILADPDDLAAKLNYADHLDRIGRARMAKLFWGWHPRIEVRGMTFEGLEDEEDLGALLTGTIPVIEDCTFIECSLRTSCIRGGRVSGCRFFAHKPNLEGISPPG